MPGSGASGMGGELAGMTMKALVARVCRGLGGWGGGRSGLLQQGEPGLVGAWRSGLSPRPCSFRVEIGGVRNCSSE